jgi:hypothetical protein
MRTMSDRKYRQRGYQDDDRERQPRGPARQAPEPGAPAGARRISQDGPKHVNMPGYREVVRCTQCGAGDASRRRLRHPLPPLRHRSTHLCPVHFVRSGQHFRVYADNPARISPKNARNGCTLFSPRTTVERETTAPRNDDARKAFDDLFKF